MDSDAEHMVSAAQNQHRLNTKRLSGMKRRVGLMSNDNVRGQTNIRTQPQDLALKADIFVTRSLQHDPNVPFVTPSTRAVFPDNSSVPPNGHLNDPATSSMCVRHDAPRIQTVLMIRGVMRHRPQPPIVHARAQSRPTTSAPAIPVAAAPSSIEPPESPHP